VCVCHTNIVSDDVMSSTTWYKATQYSTRTIVQYKKLLVSVFLSYSFFSYSYSFSRAPCYIFCMSFSQFFFASQWLRLMGSELPLLSLYVYIYILLFFTDTATSLNQSTVCKFVVDLFIQSTIYNKIMCLYERLFWSLPRTFHSLGGGL